MRRHGWPLAIGAGLGAALLVLLGALQVQWLDRVAQTIAAQKRAALHRRGSAMATDLERELTRAHLWFQLDGPEAGEPLEDRLRERWRSWREKAPHARLLAAVWLLQPAAGGGEPQARRLGPGPSGALEPAAWPSALSELRALLRDHVRLSGLLAAATGDQAWMAVMAGEAPATVVLEIDGRYLTRELLPLLAAGGAARDENGPVVFRLEHDDGRPLFPASANGSARFRAGEHDPIFIAGFRPELATPALLEGMRPPAEWPHGPVPWGPGEPPMTMRAGPFGVFSHAGGPGSRPFKLRGGPPPFPLHPPGLGTWRLSLALAAGPVDDVVTSLRRRNLALGFSILTLLGAAIAALTLAVRRAHALAEKQRQFTASISHELRTPLAVIGSAAENLRDGTVDDAARVREYGALIHAESRRLGAMVDQALHLTAGHGLREALHRRPVDVRALVDTALDSFAPEVRARAALVERGHPPEPVMVSADPEALRQAVENVVGNALKYGGEPPWVRVRVRRSDTPAGPEVQIAVEDRGLGIPADELDHVFEPFFRGREAQVRQIRGTGLGLALVARVMQAHGGRVAVESAPGRGSVFVLHLPVERGG